MKFITEKIYKNKVIKFFDEKNFIIGKLKHVEGFYIYYINDRQDIITIESYNTWKEVWEDKEFIIKRTRIRIGRKKNAKH